MAVKTGNHTYLLENTPSVLSFGAVGSKKESEGPLGRYFDVINPDSSFGESSWEKAESKMVQISVGQALSKGNFEADQIDVAFAGDLLNQCIGSAYGLRDLGIPFVGLYGACSTMAESLALAALFVDTAIAKKALAVTSSHFCSAERQFRFPLEYGGQRTPTAQWTVTGAGAVILAAGGQGPKITHVTTGMIVDAGIKDANSMGSAMAPAAYETLKAHFTETGRSPNYYDAIFTGDLGAQGHDILQALFRADGVELDARYMDCGVLMFDLNTQNVGCGGSGCGCCASVLGGHILDAMNKGVWQRVLVAATGALMSPTSAQQGDSIPGICHAVAIESGV